MKRILLPLIVFSLCMISCNKDDGYSLGDLWRSMATVENPDEKASFFFTLDNQKTMWTAATDLPYYRPKDGQRIIAYYTILSDKPESSGYDHDVVLRDVYKVLTKGIFEITPETQDSIGHDLIKIEDIWIGSNYLNIRFGYNGYNGIHYINLVSDASKNYNDGKVHLEFRHNANNDAPSYGVRGYVSFNLSSLQQEHTSPLKLVIHADEYNEPEETTYELVYNFNGATGEENLLPVEELTNLTENIK